MVVSNEELGKSLREIIKDTIEEDVKRWERYRIAKILGQVANEIFRKQDKEYPSNVCDVIGAWLSGWKLGGGHKPIEDWFLEAVAKAESKLDKDGNYKE